MGSSVGKLSYLELSPMFHVVGVDSLNVEADIAGLSACQTKAHGNA